MTLPFNVNQLLPGLNTTPPATNASQSIVEAPVPGGNVDRLRRFLLGQIDENGVPFVQPQVVDAPPVAVQNNFVAPRPRPPLITHPYTLERIGGNLFIRFPPGQMQIISKLHCQELILRLHSILMSADTGGSVGEALRKIYKVRFNRRLSEIDVFCGIVKMLVDYGWSLDEASRQALVEVDERRKVLYGPRFIAADFEKLYDSICDINFDVFDNREKRRVMMQFFLSLVMVNGIYERHIIGQA